MNTAPIPNLPVPVERANQSPAGPPEAHRHSRRRRCSGQELIEFTLCFLPFMVIVITLVSLSWAIFGEATLQQAVRMAVREGITLTSTQVTGNLTDTVKAAVQAHSVGFLNGATGLAYIKVHYFDQNNPSTDVSAQASGNTPGNIMQVSVQGYPLVPLIPRFFNWSGAIDNSPFSTTVYAADMIEPMASFLVPAIGPAP